MTIALLSCLLAAAVWAAPAPGGKTASTATGDCLSCHASLQKKRFTHGPVGVDLCSACHDAEKPASDPAKHHTFSLTQDQPDLCFSCHDSMRAQLAAYKVPHPAIDAGCTSCHDPHGSDQQFFLKDKTMDKTCSSCHEAKTQEAVTHKPVGVSCALCHNPHGSANARLLKSPPPELCYGCHQKIRQDMGRKKIHAAVKAGCVSCHNPHGAAKKNMFKTDGRKALCLDCHKQIGERIKSAKRPHGAVEKAGCVGCHEPHASNNDRLLKDAMPKLCLSCHAEKKAELESPFLHGPVKLGQCTACHDIHGADNPNILRAFFPKGFYNPYKDGLYALCFNCHEKDIAKNERTKERTDFRNGDQNLHYVHVHAQKGRSCKTCHQVHGGKQEKHIRDNVPFGAWILPITFQRTANGGTCNVGCHKPRSYDRLRAVANP